MTIAQTPLERAAISWADSAALLAAELARLTQAATTPMPRTHRRRRTPPPYLRAVPVAVAAAWAAARGALRHHATTAAIAAVTTAAATTIALPAITGLTVRTPYDYDPVSHHRAVAADPEHHGARRTVIPVVPATHEPRASGTFSPPPKATSQGAATPAATPAPTTIPTPVPSPAVSQGSQQTCVTVPLIQACVPVP